MPRVGYLLYVGTRCAVRYEPGRRSARPWPCVSGRPKRVASTAAAHIAEMIVSVAVEPSRPGSGAEKNEPKRAAAEQRPRPLARSFVGKSSAPAREGGHCARACEDACGDARTRGPTLYVDDVEGGLAGEVTDDG